MNNVQKKILVNSIKIEVKTAEKYNKACKAKQNSLKKITNTFCRLDIFGFLASLFSDEFVSDI